MVSYSLIKCDKVDRVSAKTHNYTVTKFKVSTYVGRDELFLLNGLFMIHLSQIMTLGECCLRLIAKQMLTYIFWLDQGYMILTGDL